MKKSLILVWMLTLILLVSFASATIDWNTDLITFAPLFNTNGTSNGLIDISSGEVNFSIGGTAEFNALETAFDFDYPTDYVGSTTNLVSGISAYSVCAWFSVDDLTNAHTIVGEYTGSGYRPLTLTVQTSGDLQFLVGSAEGLSNIVTTSTPVSTSTLYHVCGVYDGTQAVLYLDGSNIGDDATCGGLTELSSDEFTIGARDQDPTTSFDGEISDVIVFNKGLTSTEIGDLYVKGVNYNPYTITKNNHSIEQTVSIEQSSNVTITSSSYQPIVTGSFDTDLITNGTSTFVLNAFNNLATSRDVTCRVDIDGSYYDTTITRSISGSEYASYYLSSSNFSLGVGSNDITLECKNSVPGNTLTLNAFGIVHLYRDSVTNESINFKTYPFSSELASSNFVKLDSFNFTTTNRSVNENITKHIFLDGALQYNYDSESTISLYAVINGTKYGEYPRYGSGSTSGIVGGMFYQIPSNVANESQNITIDVYGKSSTLDGNITGQFTVKEMIMNKNEANTTSLEGLSFTGDNEYYNLTSLDISNVDFASANLVVKAGIPHNATNGVTISDFRFILSNGAFSTPISHTINSINKAEVTVIQTEFSNIGAGNYSIVLQGRASDDIIITGGDMLTYFSSQVDFDQSIFDVTLYNSWDNSSVDDFNVTLSSTGAIFESVDGVAVVTPSQSLETFTINGDGFFNKTVNNHNINTDLNTSVSASLVSFNAFEIITDLLVTPSYFTITDGVVSKTFLDGVNVSLPVGNYNVTFNKDGWFNKTVSFSVNSLDVKIVNVTDVSSTALVITAKQAVDNISISSFSGLLYNVENDITIPFSTTTGNVSVGVALDQSFIVNISSDGYASNSDVVFVNSSPTQSYVSYMYNFNSIRINVYNDTSAELLTQNITIDSIWDGDSASNSTTSGTLILDLLDPETYELRFSSVGFLNTSLFILVTNDSTQELNVYLQSSSGNELQQFSVVDQIGDSVSGAIIRLQQEVIGFDGLWQTVDEKKTNTDGATGFYVKKSTNVFYRMIVIYDSVVELITDKTLFLPGVTEIISLQIDTSTAGDSISTSNVVTTFLWSGDSNETFTFSWVDPDNLISGGRLEIYTEDFNKTGIPISLDYSKFIVGSTGTLSYTLPVVNNTRFTLKSYIVYSDYSSLVDEAVKLFGSSSLPDKNTGLLLAFVVFVFVAFITISLKPLFSSIISFGILGILSAFNVITIGTTVITSFIALAIIFFIKLKGGGSK